MMKVLIISDSHGRAKRLNEIVDRVKADHVIHCGDFCTGRSELPSVPLTVVRGNCDWEEVSEEEVFEADSLRFFVTQLFPYPPWLCTLLGERKDEQQSASSGAFVCFFVLCWLQLEGQLVRTSDF